MLFSVVFRRTLQTGCCPLAINYFSIRQSQSEMRNDRQKQVLFGFMDSAINYLSTWKMKFCSTLLNLFSYSKSGCKSTFYFTVLHVSIMIFLCNDNFNFSTSLFPFLQFMQIQLSYKCHHRLMHASCQHWPWLCGIWEVVVNTAYWRMFGRKECFN